MQHVGLRVTDILIEIETDIMHLPTTRNARPSLLMFLLILLLEIGTTHGLVPTRPRAEVEPSPVKLERRDTGGPTPIPRPRISYDQLFDHITRPQMQETVPIQVIYLQGEFCLPNTRTRQARQRRLHALNFLNAVLRLAQSNFLVAADSVTPVVPPNFNFPTVEGFTMTWVAGPGSSHQLTWGLVAEMMLSVANSIHAANAVPDVPPPGPATLPPPPLMDGQATIVIYDGGTSPEPLGQVSIIFSEAATPPPEPVYVGVRNAVSRAFSYWGTPFDGTGNGYVPLPGGPDELRRQKLVSSDN
ncbi:MAG: hypothetical protein M1833_007338 [Piccolia ochrophora]|nr:MAG: hypothetical protein M1833_007338 [Piccolia ochrophora]